MDNNNTIWVFGYGSLCWNPGFEYSQCVIGYIRGYVRRFWQGNTTHRGTKEKPGRVATLVGEKQGITYGCAFKISGKEALEYLQHRECSLGGYIVSSTKFYPHKAPEEDSRGQTFPVLLYIATEGSEHWLGQTSLESLAAEVCDSKGESGHNVEYVIRLAEFIRTEIPEVVDQHLFELESLIRKELTLKQVPLHTVMGAPRASIRRNSTAEQREQREISFEYRSRITNPKLRCLQI